MNIKEFRAKYPQYDEMPDQVLAVNLHRKHYADKMSYDEFAKRFGVPPLPTISKGIQAAKDVIAGTEQQLKKEQADATKLKRLFTFAGKSEKEAKRLANSLASERFAEQVEQVKKPAGASSLVYDYVRDIRDIKNRATPEEAKVAIDLVKQTNLNPRTIADPDAPPELQRVKPIKQPLNPQEKREAMRERSKLFIKDAANAFSDMMQAPVTRYQMNKHLSEYKEKFLKKMGLRWERGAVMVGGGAMHFMDEITKLATAGEYGDTFAEQADLYHKALSSPQMQPVIEHWGDRYFGAAIESAPFTLTAMPAAVATGGAVIPSGVNAFLTSYAIEGNMAYQAAKDRGLTEREARARGIATGIINSAFEIAGGGAGKYVRMNAIKNITGRLAKHRFLTKQLLTNAIKEGLAEEVPQELGQMFVGGDIPRMKDGSINWHKTSQRVVDTAIAGTIIGGIYGGSTALKNHAVVEYNDWITRNAPQNLEAGAPAAANITNKVEFEDSQMYELDEEKQAHNLASQIKDKAEVLGIDVEINQTGQYVEVRHINKEAQEHQNKPVQKEVTDEVSVEPTTADEAIGLEYGLNPEETRAALNEAENRYRFLKNKDKRTKAENKEIKFLKNNRKSIEDLLDRATDPQGQPINKVGDKTVQLLKDGHDLPAEFGWTEEQRQDFNEMHTGQRSMSNMTSAQRQYIVKLLKTKQAGQNRKFSSASVLKYIQPQWRTAIKLGIDFITKPLEAAKMIMDMEEATIRNEIDKMGKVINNLGKETMGTKLKGKILNMPTSARERWAKLIDKYEEAPDFLNDKEKVIFEFFRNLGNTIWLRTNEEYKKIGREPIPYRRAYIPHIASTLASDSLHNIQLWPKELSAIAKKYSTREMYNPRAFRREIEQELNSALERDIVTLAKAMVHVGMRNIHLSKPLADAKDKIGMHKVNMPKSTFNELEQYININIRGEQTRFDKLVNNILTNEGSEWALNKILKPFGRTVTSRPITSALMTGGRLQIYGVLGWRPKQWLRNKFQVLQCMALHGVGPTLKGYLAANKELEELITNDLFLQTYSGMEEMPATGMGKAKRIFMGPFQWTAVTNARHAFKTAYHDYIQLIRNPKYKKFGWADPQRDYTEADDFLYPSEREKLEREMVLSAKTTQYHYLATGMPGVFRIKAATPLTRLQSWWLNYFFSFQAANLRRAVKGETLYGEKLPFSRRVNALKYFTLGGTLLNTLGYGSSFAAGTVPRGLPPYAGAIYHLFMWLKGLFMGNDKIRKAESRKFWNNAKTLVPGYFTAKDIIGLLTGKTRFQEWLFYAGSIFDKEEKGSTYEDFKGL